MAGLRYIYCVFQKDDRIVVCKCNGPATALHCRVCNRLGQGQILDPVKVWALEMSQFWQNLQVRLQPAVPNDRTGVPGKK